jgi:hypothetical protein
MSDGRPWLPPPGPPVERGVCSLCGHPMLSNQLLALEPIDWREVEAHPDAPLHLRHLVCPR